MKFGRLLAAAILFTAACSSDLPHESPFDALSPLDKQAKASLSGRVTLQDETDFSQVTVELLNGQRTYNTDTQSDGTVRLTGVVPGAYTLSIRTRYFEAVTETVTITLGEELDLGVRNLAPRQSKVSGSATLETVANNAVVTSGGVTLILTKTSSIRGVKAAPPGLWPSAASITGETHRTVSGDDGAYEFNGVPAGGYSFSASSRETGERAVGDVTVTGEGDLTMDPIVLQPLTGFFEIVGKIWDAAGLLQSSSIYTAVPQVVLQLTGSSSATRMKIAESADGTPVGCNFAAAATLTYDALHTHTFTTEGAKMLCVVFVDADGEETDPLYGTIISDATPPVLPSIGVNNGATVVSSGIVTLNLSAADALSGLAVYRVDSSSNLDAIPDRAFQFSDVYSLAPPDGVKTLWVSYGDRAGNYSAPVSTMVVLDTTSPFLNSVTVTTLDGSSLASGQTVNEGRVIITSSVDDASLLQMQVSTSPTFAGSAWEAYSTAKVVDLSLTSSSLWVRVRDGAGLVTPILSGFIINLDRTAPVLSLGPTTLGVTNVRSVDLTMSANESSTDAQVSEDPGFSNAVWFPTANTTYALMGGDGLHTIYARARDAAGNLSSVKTVQVTLDETAPQVAGLTITEGALTNQTTLHLQITAFGADEMQLSESASFSGAGWGLFTSTPTFALSGVTNGTRTVYARFRDTAGNMTIGYSDSTTLDTQGPDSGAWSIVINDGDTYATQQAVTLALAATGATEMKVSEDPLFTGAAWEGYATQKSFFLSSSQIQHTVYVMFRDDVGNLGTTASDAITLDTSAPQSPSISGPDYVTQTTVTLALSAANADVMMVSESLAFTDTTWQSYSSSLVFTLANRQGSHTVYAKYGDLAGNESATVSSTFILDSVAPTVTRVALSGSAYSATANIELTLLASGADTMKIAETADLSAISAIPYAALGIFPVSVTNGAKTIYVEFQDSAGNKSSTYSVNVTLDTEVPVLDAISIDSAATYATNRVVSVALTPDDPTASEMQIGEDPLFGGSAWQTYRSSLSYTLQSVSDGSKTIYVRTRDLAGNVSATRSDTIQLDTVAPADVFIAKRDAPIDYAAANAVIMRVNASGADYMQLSTDGTFSPTGWATYASNATVTVASGDGLKNVWVQFKDTAGNLSQIGQTSFFLDTAAPEAGTLTFAEGYYTNSRDVFLKLNATGADFFQVDVTTATLASQPMLPMQPGRPIQLADLDGLHTYYVRYLDRAGNASAPVAASILLDRDMPIAGPWSIRINAGGTTTREGIVFLNLAVTGATEMQVRNNDYFDAGGWEPVTSSTTWLLEQGDGDKKVYVRFRDEAGNTTASFWAQIELDTAAPTVTGIELLIASSSTELTLSWDPSFVSGVTGYTWYRHRDGLTTVGGTVAAAVTSVAVTLPITAETYSVAAWYGAQKSAHSTPAVESGAFHPTKGILLVDDDGEANSVEDNLVPALTVAGIAYDATTVTAGYDGPDAATLLEYQVVLWSTGEGPTAPTLSAFDRESLKTYLTTGGNLVFLGSDAASDGDTATFLKRWFHTGRVEADLPAIQRLFLPASDLVPGGADFPVGPPLSGVDAIYGSSLSDEFMNAGKAVGVRYPLPGAPAPYRAAWLGTPTSGLYQRDVFTFNTDTVNIPVTGATITISDGTPLQNLNDAAARVPLPFYFSFGGVVTNAVWVSSNGLVSFQVPITGTPYPMFPTTDTANYPGSLIAPFWVDMEAGGQIYFENRITEVTFVWYQRPVTGYDYWSGFTWTTVTSALVLRENNQFVMERTSGEWIGQKPNLGIVLEDENGIGIEPPRVTEASWCCDNGEMAIAAFNYSDTVVETVTWLQALVNWSAVPTNVRRIANRAYRVDSNVTGAAGMRVSTDGGFDTEPIVAFNASLPVTTFTGGDGSKTVQVVYIDAAGNQTSIYSDTKTLDTVVPQVSSVVLIDPVTGSNAFTKNRTVTLQILGTATAADFMRVSESPIFSSMGFIPYVESSTFTLSEGEGAKHLYVWLRDSNGNISAPGEGSIVLDGMAPATRAVAQKVANAAPFVINTSYEESQDASTTWASLPAGYDTGTQTTFFKIVNLKWSFPFYGQGASQLIIWPAGFVTLGALEVGGTKPFPLDEGVTREDVFNAWQTIAPLYVKGITKNSDSIDVGISYARTGDGIFFAEGDDWVMVRWSGEDPRTQEPVNTAVLLYQDGRIKFVYGDGNLNSGALVGISKGDGLNETRTTYDEDSMLSQATTLDLTPNSNTDARVKLYYRYRYPEGAGAWTDTGVGVSSVFEAIAFYPPLGAGTYEFYTVGIDEAGNVESAPASADVEVLFDDAAPLPPIDLAAEADEDSVYVQWTPSISPDVVAYLIYYGTDLKLDGTDASEGASPIQISADDHIRLSNLEPGVETYVVVTSVDHVGNESARPSGASFLLPHSVRPLARVTAGAHGALALIDDSLFAYNDNNGDSLVWYDLRNPAVPTVAAQTMGSAYSGKTVVVSEGVAYSGAYRYDISNYGTISANMPFTTSTFMAPVTPFTMVWSTSPNTFGQNVTFGVTRFDGTVVMQKNGPGRGIAVEGNLAFTVVDQDCPGGGGGGPCPSPLVHAAVFDAAGNSQFLGPITDVGYSPDSLDLASGLLALSSGQWWSGRYSILDVNNPLAPLALTSPTNVRGSLVRWAGDRLVSAGGAVLQLNDTGDLSAPIMEGTTTLSGTVSDFKMLDNLGIVSTSAGLDLFEFGELLPSRVRTLSQNLDENPQSIVVSRNYAFVADGNKLLVFNTSALSGGTMDLVATYAPFSANALLLAGQYLFATEGQDLYVLDVSNPYQPQLVWQWQSSWSSSGWRNTMSLIGTKLYTGNRAYDISDPSRPVEDINYEASQLRLHRAGGEYLYAIREGTNYDVNVYKPTANGLNLVGSQTVTSVVDMAVDGRTLYLLRSSMGGPCCGPTWNELLVADISNPTAPYAVTSFTLPEVLGGSFGSGGGHIMTVFRGFLYLPTRGNNGGAVVVQVDMRDRTRPVVALEIAADGSQQFSPPLIVTPDNYMIVPGSRSLNVFHVTPNVPLRESMHPDTVGAEQTVIGDRYVYFAVGNEISQLERRAPALKLALVGSGEVAFTKKGATLQLFDPPGVPAASLTTDGTGRFDLNDTRYDIAGELCAALENTGRLTCTLSIPSSVPAHEIVDAYGVRVKATRTASLRAQKLKRKISLPAGAKINELVFQNHRLFAAVSEEPPTAAAVEGLYVIDPKNLTANYHDLGVTEGTQAYSLAVRDSYAFIGTRGAVLSYEWPTRSAPSGIAATPTADVRHLAMHYTKLYFIDDSPAGSILRCAGGTFGGGIYDCGYSRTFFGEQMKDVVSLGRGYVALATTTTTWIYSDTGSNFNDITHIENSGDQYAFVNGVMLMANGSDLSFYDMSEMPPVNLVRRQMTVGGTVRDFSVSGDMLSVAAEGAGGIIFRLR